MKNKICVFIFSILFISGFSQVLGISGGLAYVKTDRGADYLMEKNKPWLGGRLESTWLSQNDTGVYTRYKSAGFEYYYPKHDSADMYVVQGTSPYAYPHSGIKANSHFSFSGRFGFAIPQHINPFLMIFLGYGFGIDVQKTNFRISKLNADASIQYYQPKGAPLPISCNIAKGRNRSTLFGAFTEIFTGFIYELPHFYVYGTLGFRFIFNADFEYQIQHTATIGIFYPLKLK